MVNIVVSHPEINAGAIDPKPFHVHQSLLIRHSPHFATLLGGENEETKDIQLENVRRPAFAALVTWLYCLKAVEVVHPDATVMELAQIWELGERFEMLVFQNDLIAILVHRLLTVPAVGYEHSSANDYPYPLCTLEFEANDEMSCRDRFGHIPDFHVSHSVRYWKKGPFSIGRIR